jgi:hypothetical protein
MIGTGRARWARLVPIAVVVHVISSMDRTNTGFALPGLQHDVHVDEAQQGLAAGTRWRTEDEPRGRPASESLSVTVTQRHRGHGRIPGGAVTSRVRTGQGASPWLVRTVGACGTDSS